LNREQRGRYVSAARALFEQKASRKGWESPWVIYSRNGKSNGTTKQIQAFAESPAISSCADGDLREDPGPLKTGPVFVAGAVAVSQKAGRRVLGRYPDG
jgi:hypothetical protein